jgi:DNA-binding NarL/FixJ family response regulator
MTVAVVDQQLTFADTVATRLLDQADVQRTSAHTTTDSLMAALRDHTVDVVLLDWTLCHSASQPLRALADRHPGVAVVVTGTDRDPWEIVAAMHAGALAWLPKDVPFEELLIGIRSALRGDRWVPGHLLTAVLESVTSATDEEQRQPRALQPLTRREREVLQCMVDGLSRNQIADRLGMSPNTVRTHIQNVLHKFDVHSSLRAVALARQAGLVARGNDVPQQRRSSESVPRKDRP